MNQILAALLFSTGITAIIIAIPREDTITSSSTNLPSNRSLLTHQLISRINKSLADDQTGLDLNQISQITTTQKNSFSALVDPNQFSINGNGLNRMEYVVFPENFNDQHSNLMILVSIYDKKTNNKIWEKIEKFENE